MKKLIVLLSLVLFIPASVSAAEKERGLLEKLKGAAQKLLGQGASGPGGSNVEKGNTYIIHLSSGGKIESDNYTMEKNRIRIEIPAGAIYLDKSMVKSIEEVTPTEWDPVQTIKVQPNPQPQEKNAPPPAKTKAPNPPPPIMETPKDDNGHDESWWRDKVEGWKKKRAEAQAKYDRASADWNIYNGQIATLSGSGGSQFDITKTQDLKGGARVSMDNAQADLDNAKRMLEEVLPEEARKAGAPPGWARE